MNERRFIARVPLAALGAMFLLSAAVAGAAPCTKADLKGRYGFTLQGTVHPTPPSPSVLAYTATAGIIRFNGTGNLSVTGTISTNGVVITDSVVTGTYTVNPDCTALVTLSNLTAVNAVAGKREGKKIQELLFISTDNGTVVTGFAKKQKQ